MSGAGSWDPAQYGRFAAQRRQAFDDLVSLVRPVPGGQGADLGCGSGALTVELHRRLGLAGTIGVDSSSAMLDAEATTERPSAVRFERGDIADWAGAGLDVIVANASLHWVPDHPRLLARLTGMLRAGGQLAVQVPANHDQPSHTVLRQVAAESPFGPLVAGHPVDAGANVLPPERYATLLDELGYAEQHVRLQVYGHHLASSEDVVEWVRGSTLSPYRSVLAPAVFDDLVDRYRRRLLDAIGAHRPYFFPFKRILFWARRPAD